MRNLYSGVPLYFSNSFIRRAYSESISPSPSRAWLWRVDDATIHWKSQSAWLETMNLKPRNYDPTLNDPGSFSRSLSWSRRSQMRNPVNAQRRNKSGGVIFASELSLSMENSVLSSEAMRSTRVYGRIESFIPVLGSGPDRGWSPVERRAIPFARPFSRPAIRPLPLNGWASRFEISFDGPFC